MNREMRKYLTLSLWRKIVVIVESRFFERPRETKIDLKYLMVREIRGEITVIK